MMNRDYYSPMLGMHFPDEKLGRGAEQKAILDQLKRQNESLKKQNIVYNTNNYTDSGDLLETLAYISILGLIFGIVSLIFLPKGTPDDIRQISVYIVIMSMIAPVLCIIKNILKLIFKPIKKTRE